MKRQLTICLLFIAILNLAAIPSFSEETKTKGEKVLLSKPTAQQVFRFVEIIKQHPESNHDDAIRALQDWMDGKLQVSAPTVSAKGDAGACAACIGGCCGFFACNPFCIAGCVAGICK